MAILFEGNLMIFLRNVMKIGDWKICLVLITLTIV